MKWTRESAASYLANNPSFQFSKPIDEYSTPYLKRVAGSYQKAEQAGQTPSRSKARGHAAASIKEEKRDKGKGILGRVVMKPHKDAGGEMTNRDLKRLAKRGKRDDILLVITGKPNRGSRDKNFKPGDTRSYSYWTTRETIDLFLEEEGLDGDITDFANELSGLEWDDIESISIAFPEDES